MHKKLVNNIEILLTPQTPRIIKLILGLWMVSVQVLGQSVSVDEEVKQSIKVKYDSISEYEIYNHNKVKRWKFLNFIPSPGYSVLQGPTLSYNLSNVFSFLESKERYRIAAEKTRNEYHEKAEKEYDKYLVLKRKYEEQQFDIKYQEQILELERKLFAITEQKYKNHEITPTQYLSEEIQFEKKKLELEKLKHQVKRTEDEISMYTKANYYADAN